MFGEERLEYEKVLQSVQTYCGWEYSARKMLLIRPQNVREDVQKAFAELQELLRGKGKWMESIRPKAP